MANLVEFLDQFSAPAELFSPEQNGALRCLACAHRCLIKSGRRGICQVRYNTEGVLYAPWGYVAGAQVDPIEKKPFNHFLPGASALTFGMLGCNLHCSFCQNWLSSQAPRDPRASASLEYIQRTSPEELVKAAKKAGAEIVASSYNEPLITSEWALAIFKQARSLGLKTVMISNGYATPEGLQYLRPYLDGYKIDLKTMQEKQYRALGGVLQHVLDSIRTAHELGLWVEVVTLVIPGFNDTPAELWDAARFLASISPEIPWHVTAFHPDYHMRDVPPTSTDTLQLAAEVGQEAGLHYIYAGNLPGRVGSLEDTFCPNCHTRLVGRRGYRLSEYQISATGQCLKCGAAIPGVWSDTPGAVRLQEDRFPWRIP
jgi:pyruvate formate lyase activating enzyme